MALNFEISSVDWDKVEGDAQDRVSIKTLHWRLTQTEPNPSFPAEPYVATYYESTDPDQERLLTIQQVAAITKPQVIQWVRNRIGSEREAEILAMLQAQIDEQMTPTKGSFVPVDE